MLGLHDDVIKAAGERGSLQVDQGQGKDLALRNALEGKVVDFPKSHREVGHPDIGRNR